MEERLTKRERLKSKLVIDQLFIEGKSINQYPLKLIYLPLPNTPDSCSKIMVVAPKKKFKKAVDRNRVKRLLRESYRQQKTTIFNNINQDFAFAILYLGKEMPTYVQIQSQMGKLFSKFHKKISDEKTV